MRNSSIDQLRRVEPSADPPGALPAVSPAVVVCGEALIDLIQQPDGSFLPVPGGGPKNTATALGRWGIPVALVARFGHDRLGELLRANLLESGVDLSLVAATAEPTTLAMAALDESGGASYSFYINGCSDGTWSVEGLPPSFGQARICVIAGSLSLPIPSMSVAFDHLFQRESSRVILFDPNIRPALIHDRGSVTTRLDRWVSQATIVKASSDDVAWRHPGLALDEVARCWLGLGPSLVVITEGARGARAFTASHSVSRPSPRVAVVDTVGAGDTFTAGLVDWLLRHRVDTVQAIRELTTNELTSAVDEAAAVAADTCTRRGADPPWRRKASP